MRPCARRATIAESRSCCFAADSRRPTAPDSRAAFAAASAFFFAAGAVFAFERADARRGVFAFGPDFEREFPVVFDVLFDVLFFGATREGYVRPPRDTPASAPADDADHEGMTRAMFLLAGLVGVSESVGIIAVGHVLHGVLI